MTDTFSRSESISMSTDRSQAGANAQPDSALSARWDICSHLRLWPIAVAGLAIDLWSKEWAFSNLSPEFTEARTIIPHLMSFQRSLNTGALFGLGKGLTPVFIAASILALGFVLFLFIHSTRDRRSLHVALGLVLAGALGNLYDRAFVIADVVSYNVKGETIRRVVKVVSTSETGITVSAFPSGDRTEKIPAVWNPTVRQQGVVRDFVKMEPRIGSIQIWPWVFNAADVLLVVGVGLLMINFWWDRKAEQRARGEAPAAAVTSGG